MSKSTDGDAAKARAEALFRQQRSGVSEGGPQAAETEAEKTARLRALRLAKEQSDQIASEVRKARRQQR